MSTNNFRSCRIRRSPGAFGALSASTNLPDESIFNGTDDAILACHRVDIVSFGEIAMNERDDIKGGPAFYDIAPDPASVPDETGLLLHRRTGQVTLNMDLEGNGSSTIEDNPLYWIIGSNMIQVTASTTDETVTAHATAQTFTVSDETDYEAGELIQATLVGGRAEFSAIVSNETANVTHSPAFSSELNDDEIRRCVNFVGRLGSRGADINMRFDYHDHRTFAFGGRWTSLAFSDEGGRCQVAITIQFALMYDKHADVDGELAVNAEVLPFRTGGAVLHTMDSEVIISNAIDTADNAYPRIAGRTQMRVGEGWTVTFTAEVQPIRSWNSILAVADFDLVNLMVEAVLPLDLPLTSLHEMFKRRQQRQLMLGMGPGRAGNGACIFLPAAFLTTDPSLRDYGTGVITQPLTFKAGYWGGDYAGADSLLAKTAMRIGFAL